MRLRIFTGISTLAIATVACTLGSLLPFSSSNTTSNISQAVDPNTKPIQVTTTLDQSHAATTIIGPDGGTLSTTGADGTRFTLDIPAQALVETIEVSMIPITAMNGIPWKSGPVAAVQLEPDGQEFYGFVTLTIEPAGDIPVDQFIPIGASGPGHDLYMPALDPKSTNVQLKLGHFSSAGATKGLLADVEPWRQKLGGDVEARLNSIIAQELGRDRQLVLMGQEPPDDTAFIAEMKQAYIEYVLKPRLAAAGTNCAAGRLAIQTLLGMERQAELLGTTFDPGVDTSGLLLSVGKVCLQEEY